MENKKFALLCFALVLPALALCGFLFAQDAGIAPIAGGNIFAISEYTPIINIITLGLAMMAFAASLVYMASQALKNPEWEAFAKTEIFQGIISVLIGLLLFAGAVAADAVVGDYVQKTTGVGGMGAFDVTHNYLNRMICVSSATTLKLEGMKMGAQYLAGMKARFYAATYGWGFSFPAFPGFDVIERSIDLILMFITPFTASLFAQQVGLEIVHATALALVLPAGILMRVFAPTRDAGGFLIATAFAFYFILPFSYMINAQVMYKMYQDDFGYPMCSGKENWDRADYVFGAGAVYDSISLQLLPKLKEDFIGAGGFTKHLSYIVMQSVFLPALNMVLVVTFVKAGTKFFSNKLE